MHFGDFEFNSLSGQLFREGRSVKIQPQPLRVLGVLLEKPGEIVSREHLRTCIWGDSTFVEFDQGLNYCIRQIRVALRDGSAKPLYIETLPKQGYRFIALVSVTGGSPEPSGTNHSSAELAATEATTDPPKRSQPGPPARQVSVWRLAFTAVVALGIGGAALYSSFARIRFK